MKMKRSDSDGVIQDGKKHRCDSCMAIAIMIIVLRDPPTRNLSRTSR